MAPGSSLTVLTDQDVRELLESLTKEDIGACHKALADALHSYSTAIGPSDSASCASNQPDRISIKQADGSSVLFMPSTSDTALGVKVLTVSEAPSKETPSDAESFSSRATSSQSPARSMSSAMSSISLKKSGSDASLSSKASTTPSSKTHSSSFSHPKLAEDIREPLGMLEPSATSPKGCLTILDRSGKPRALINASTLTAFRTALASTLVLRNRRHVHTLTVFGAGMQAYWHIYLTLLLKPEELHHINVINRDFARAQRLFMSLAQSNNPAISDAFLSQKLRPTILTHQHSEYHRLLKEHVRNADVIYCCTPSTECLFPATHLTNPEGRKKARYIACIGSYKPHMQELHEDILRQAVRGPEAHHSHLHVGHKQVHEGGAIIVDTIEGAMKEAGEIIKAGISGQGLVEIGEIVMLKRTHWAEKAEQEARERSLREQEKAPAKAHGGHGLGHLFHRDQDKAKQGKEKDDGLQTWLERGNVIYKSVGMGLMDLCVGAKLVELAEQRGFGTRIDDF